MTFEDDLSSALGKLKAGRELLLGSCSRRVVKNFTMRMSKLMDSYFISRFKEAEMEGLVSSCGEISVAAVGGYGRGRLAPFSDLDVLIVVGKKPGCNLEELVSFLFYPLWDLKFDVGYGIRTVKENLKLASTDYKVMTSLIDLRFLVGNSRPADELDEKFSSQLRSSAGRALIKTLWENRIKGVSDMDCVVLEPDLKNGWGGLRDVNFLFWSRSVLGGWGPLNAVDISTLHADNEYLLEVRSALHLVSGRKKDVLALEKLPEVASLCGVRDYNPARRGEKLLSVLHRAMIRIRSMGAALYREGFTPSAEVLDWDGEGGIKGAMEVFRSKSKSGLPLSRRARRLISGVSDSAEGNHSGILTALIEILRAPDGWKTSLEMLDSGLLTAILPEFARASELVPFDGYHQHTPGRHALLAVRKTIEIIDDEFSGVGGLSGGDTDLLVLAALMHDIAKGSDDHSIRGAEVASGILEAAGINGEESADVIFLIREHLLLVQAARRIDMSDSFSLRELVRKIGGIRRLKMLFVLSMADSMATGPRVWNRWSEGLLRELYSRLYSLLDGQGLRSAEDLVLKRRAQLRKFSSGVLNKAFLEETLDSMPDRYLLSFEPGVILEHLKAVAKYREALAKDLIRRPSGRGGLGVNVVRECLHGNGWVQVVVAAMDQPLLFSTQAGVFSLHGLDVLSAEFFSWADNTALNVFTLRESGENKLPADVWERAQRSIFYAMTGRLALDYRLHKKRSSFLESRSVTYAPTVITLDNDSSENSTIIEIQTGDRTGLLYDISQVFSRMNADIKMARICTSGINVFDAFHLRGADGRKIVDKGQLDELVRALNFAACNPS